MSHRPQAARHRLNTPEVLGQDLERGLLLIGDLGERLYLDALDEASVERLYGDALAALVVIQACGPTEGLPIYDGPFLLRELGIFQEWLLGHHLGLDLTPEEAPSSQVPSIVWSPMPWSSPRSVSIVISTHAT
jgi:aminoglycoside/choline kinase family phosphotransferase